MAGRFQMDDREDYEKLVPEGTSRRPRELVHPGPPKGPMAPTYHIHPRHPRASQIRSDGTRGNSQDDMRLQSFVPPMLAPAALDETAKPNDPQDVDLQEPSRITPRQTVDLNWPLAEASMPYPADLDPFSSAADERPQRPPRPNVDFSVADLMTIQGSAGDPTKPSTITEAHENLSEVLESTAHSRRAWSQGPPPSSRRGPSALYSDPPPVAPIAEERLSSGSLLSRVSSAGMPDYIYTDRARTELGLEGARNYRPVTGDYGEMISESSGDSPRPLSQHHGWQPSLSPHVDPFQGESSFVDASVDSSTFCTHAQTPEASPSGMTSHLAPTPITVPDVASSPMSPNLEESRKESGSPQPVKRNARRPPRLDIDAVREAEARGSLTSLPDLIMRATRLAAMIDKGRRPTSGFHDLDFASGKDLARLRNGVEPRRNSGLSDMLASFPPPADPPAPSNARRSSFFVSSWPRLPGVRERGAIPLHDPKPNRRETGRRCCGLPVWAAILIFLAVICVIVVVIVLPLELVVFNHSSGTALRDCQKSLECLHGGTNVVAQNVCSCICTNGHTGASCNIAGSKGCVETNLVATDGSSRISNVTLGKAIPRVIAASNTNYSIPLSATMILAKFNSGNLSCDAQNSLITFDGQDTRLGVSMEAILERRVKMGQRRASMAPPVEEATSADFFVTEDVLDFARTAVLYVLQEESIDSASSAQEDLQHFFSQATLGITEPNDQVTVQEASNLSIGAGKTVDLVLSSVNLGKGEVGHANALRKEVAADPERDLFS